MIRAGLLGFTLLLFTQSCTAQLRGKVVHIHDGDTFIMLVGCERFVTVRMAAIDCPELAQPYGASARRRTAKLIYGKDITVDSLSTDRYGRTIGIVILPGGDTLNHLLLAEGLAWQYTQYDSSTYLHQLQTAAQHTRTGLWKRAAVAPWVYRQQ